MRCSVFSTVPLCVVCSSEGREEDVHHLLGESWPRLEGEVAPFFSGDLVEGNTECILVLAHPWKLVGLALVTVLFLLEPRASDLKPIKNEIKSSTKEETCASKKSACQTSMWCEVWSKKKVERKVMVNVSRLSFVSRGNPNEVQRDCIDRSGAAFRAESCG